MTRIKLSLVFTGVNKVIDQIFELERVLVVSSVAKSFSIKVIDIILTGNIDTGLAYELIQKAELSLKKKNKCVCYTLTKSDLVKQSTCTEEYLLLWSK